MLSPGPHNTCYTESVAGFRGDEQKGGAMTERRNRKGVRITNGGMGPDQVWGKFDAPVGISVMGQL